MNQTQGQVEAAITKAIVKFEGEFMGRGPTGCRTYLVENLVVVHLTGTMTKGEYQLAKNATPTIVNGFRENANRELIKSMRRELLERGRPLLEKAVNGLTGRRVVSVHTDMSTVNGDRVIVFLMDDVPEVVDKDNIHRP